MFASLHFTNDQSSRLQTCFHFTIVVCIYVICICDGRAVRPCSSAAVYMRDCLYLVRSLFALLEL